MLTNRPAEPTENHVTLRGLAFHYLEWNSQASSTLVLVHGLTSLAWNWQPVVPAFLDRYRVIALDQRGHGDTDRGPADAYTTGEYVADLVAFLDYLGLQRVSLVGHSMGGHNGLALAAWFPERLRALVVVDMTPRLELSRLFTRQQHINYGKPVYRSVEDATEWLRSLNPRSAPEHHRLRAMHGLHRLPDGMYTWKYDLSAYVNFQPANLWPELSLVRAPTLLIRGRDTFIGEAATFRRMAETLPDCEYAEFDDCGHNVTGDQPSRFIETTLEFLMRAERGAAGEQVDQA